MRKNYRLSVSQSADAREAVALLDGTGLTLTDAARMARGGGQWAEIDEISVSTGCDRFLARCLWRIGQGSMRQGTYHFYEDALNLFCNIFGDRKMNSITRVELRKHFESLPVSPARQAGRYRSVRAMFRFGGKEEPRWFRDDPTAGLEIDIGQAKKTISFLTVDQAREIMDRCLKYRSALALVMFGGVRIEEVAGKDKSWMQWQHVDIDGRHIRIPAEIAKTGRPRIQEGLPDNIWSWLEAEKKDGKENISPSSAHSIAVAAKVALGGKWKQNVLRHSFATYHLAAYNDPGKLSVLLGHEGNPSMLYRHYRGLATQADGLAYFGIVG